MKEQDKEQLRKKFDDFWFKEIVAEDGQSDRSYIFDFFYSEIEARDKEIKELKSTIDSLHKSISRI